MLIQCRSTTTHSLMREIILNLITIDIAQHVNVVYSNLSYFMFCGLELFEKIGYANHSLSVLVRIIGVLL